METQQEARGLGMSQQLTSQILVHQQLSPGAPEVGELTSRPAACRESQELIIHKAQQDGSEALEGEKARPAVTLKEKELSLRSLKENWIKEISKLHSAVRRGEQLLSDRIGELKELNTQICSLQEAVLEKDAAQAMQEKQLLQELEESRAGERRLRDSVQVLEAEVSELHLRLRSSEARAEALATHCQQPSGVSSEAQSQLDKLLLVLHRIIRDSSHLVTGSSEEGHVVSLTASQASNVPAELTVDRVAAALQNLWQHLEHSQKDLNDARKKIQALKLQLSTTQAQRDYLSACNQELQKQLAEGREVMWRTERKNSLETALKEEATARKEEAVTLHHEVASLQRKLENAEKERKDVLHERDSLQADKEKLECQIKLLEESVTASETRANTAIERNCSLQEELQTVMPIFQIKTEKLETQEKKMEMLQKEAAEAKALQGHLTRMTADLSEKEREIKLYQEQMRLLEKKNLMHTTSLQRKELNQMRREAEREAMKEELERVTAALKQRENRELEWRQKAQALSAALAKSEMSKGTLRKKLNILQRMAPGRDTDWSCLQRAVGAEGKRLSRHSRKGLECVLGLVASSEEKAERRELNAEPRRNPEQVEHQQRSQMGRCRRQDRDSLLPVHGASKELE